MSARLNGWCVVLLLSGANVFAAEVEMPAGKERPKNVRVDVNGFALRHWNIIEGTPLYRLPQEDSEKLGELTYLERVFVAEGYPPAPRPAALPREQDAEWCLVATANKADQSQIASLRGWVRRRALLHRALPEIDPNSRIYKKACVVVPIEEAKRLVRQRLQPKPLVPLLSPSAKAKESEFPLKLYELFFVYAEMNDWLLIGRKPLLNAVEDTALLRDNLIGWIPEGRVARWNTRECVEWDRTTVGARVQPRRPVRGALYLSENDALDSYVHASSSNPGAGPDVLQEPWNPGDDLPPVAFDRMRFHLLLSAEDVQRRGHKVARPAEWTNADNQLMELGVVGAYIGPGESMGAEELARRREQLDSLSEQVGETELLFVIDDSESMVDWFSRTADLVKRLVESMNQSEGGRVRVAVTYYNDAVPDKSNPNPAEAEQKAAEKAVEYGPLLDLRDREEYATLLARLRDHKVHQDPKDDTPLARVCDGLSIGIDKCGFRANTRKLVILIGDMGDKRQGKSALDDLLKRIVKQLVPEDGSFCEFHAIQVVKSNTKNLDYLAFREQFKDSLRQLYRDEIKKNYESDKNKPDDGIFFTYTSGALDVEALAQTVIPKFRRAREAGLHYRHILKRISLGGLGGAEVAQLSDSVLQHIFQQEGVGKFVSDRGIQPYQTVYAWEYCPAPVDGKLLRQLRRKLLVANDELKRASDMISGMETRMRENRNANAADVVQKFLEKQAGEDADDLPSDRSRSEALIRSLCFRSDLFQGFLAKRIGHFSQQEFGHLLVIRDLLNDIKADRLAEPDKYQVVREEAGGVIYARSVRKRDPATGREYPKLDDQRGFDRNGIRWYYIDFETEWP